MLNNNLIKRFLDFETKRKLNFIVPGIKIFPYSMREAWSTLFKKKKIPFEWIIHKEGRPEETAQQIGQEALVLLLNDHHLFDLCQYLYDKTRYGRGRDDRVWLGLSTEKVIGSIFARSEEKTRICARLCHMVAHFDPSAGALISSEGAKPYFCHQYVDTYTFKEQLHYFKKKDGLFWVGKLKVGDWQKAYEKRRRLFEAIRLIKGVSWREATNPERSTRQIVKERNRFKGLINLPSNCPGYTASFFEHLSVGGCTLQYITKSPTPDGLEENIHFLTYDAEKPEDLKEKCENFLKEPRAFAKVAQHGAEVCRKKHSLNQRALEIFEALSVVTECWDAKTTAYQIISDIIKKLKES